MENNSLHLIVEGLSGVTKIALVLSAVSLLLSQNFHANIGKSLNLSLPLGFFCVSYQLDRGLAWIHVLKHPSTLDSFVVFGF